MQTAILDSFGDEEGLFGLVFQRDAEQFQSYAQDKQQCARPRFWSENHQRGAQ
jgi:hypothetical protein